MEDTKQTFQNGSILPYGLEKVSQEEANYAPFGFTGEQGCATCRWFQPAYNGCHVVEGAIVPTGLSDLYNPLRPQDQMSELLADFAESMGDMELGAAMADDQKAAAKQSLFSRLFRRHEKDVNTAEESKFDTPTGFKVVGDNTWIAWYTNPYQDRDREWFAEKAIDADLAFMEETGEYPELWRYHVGTPGNSPTRHGKAFAVTKSGRIVIAFGEFDNTPLADAFKAYYKENPNQALSHGFYYDPDLKKDGVYHKFHTFEISTLPPDVAANPFTSFGIKTGDRNMPAANEKAIADIKAALQGRLSEAQINEVLTAAAAKSAELDQAVSFKGKAEEETKEQSEPELSADTKALLGAFADLKSTLATMSGTIDGLKAKIAPPDDEEMEDDEAEEYAKKPKKKSRATADSLSPQVTEMLRTLVQEKGVNEGATGIDAREADPATAVLNKMFGGSNK